MPISYQTIELGDIESYINLCMKLRSCFFWSFRGQRKESWNLGPHIFDGGDGDLTHLEYPDVRELYRKKVKDNIDIFQRYFSESLEFQLLQNKNNEWMWHFYAQHYGLKTMLLDWTSNPLVALYFAVENVLSTCDDNEIGAVWALTVPEKRFYTPKEGTDPMVQEEWGIVNPPPLAGLVPRMVRQSGKFTIHPDHRLIETDLKPDDKLIKIILRDGLSDGDINPAKRIRWQLGIMNIHHASMFPESENVTKYLNKQWRFIAKSEHLKTTEPIYYRPNPEYLERVADLEI